MSVVINYILIPPAGNNGGMPCFERPNGRKAVNARTIIINITTNPREMITFFR